MCACQSATFISGTRNPGLSGQTSGGTGYPRRNSSLVGARLLRQEMGAKNCRDRRKTRRTRFSPGKAVAGRPDILPRLAALCLHASARGITSRLTMTCFASRQLTNSIGLQFTRLGKEVQWHGFISKLSPPNTQLNTSNRNSMPAKQRRVLTRQ